VDQKSNPNRELSQGDQDDKGLTRTFAASIFIVLVGLSVLWAVTNGGQGFTTETIRRSQVAQNPQKIAPFELLKSNGEGISLQKLLDGNKKVFVVDFVYTRCQTVCRALGTAYQQLQADIIKHGLQDKVGLLSISFDPDHDDATALQRYEQRMNMNPNIWQLVSLKNPKDIQRLLDSFGIIVIAAPLGEYEHNAAFHFLTRGATLVKILGVEDFASVIDQAFLLTANNGQTL
jgi:protein SCO1